MSEIHSRKVAEGDAALAKARKMEKPTLFRWKPDYEKASESYEEAGNAYKTAKAHEKASEAFAGAGNCYEKMDELFRAGRSFDLAATMAKEIKDMERTAEYYSKASYAYRLHGNSDKGADMMFKAAKALEEVDEKRALEKYVEACDLYQTEGKDFYSGECFRSAVAFCIKVKAFDQAIGMMVRQIDVFRRNDQRSYLNKAILSIIIIDLYGDDFVRAELDFQKYSDEISSFPGSDEHKVASGLIEAFENRDQAALLKVIKNPVVNFLEQQIIKIAKTLNVDSASNTAAKPLTPTATSQKQETPAAERLTKSTPQKSPAAETRPPVASESASRAEAAEETPNAAEETQNEEAVGDAQAPASTSPAVGAADDEDYDDYGGSAANHTAPAAADETAHEQEQEQPESSKTAEGSPAGNGGNDGNEAEEEEDGLC